MLDIRGQILVFGNMFWDFYPMFFFTTIHMPSLNIVIIQFMVPEWGSRLLYLEVGDIHALWTHTSIFFNTDLKLFKNVWYYKPEAPMSLIRSLGLQYFILVTTKYHFW